MTHHPGNVQIEEQRQQLTAVSHAGGHVEAGLTASQPECEVVVKARDDEDNLQ